MTSLQGLLPPPGSSNWRKSVRVYTDSDDEANVVRHVVIREVWVEKRPWPHAVSITFMALITPTLITPVSNCAEYKKGLYFCF